MADESSWKLRVKAPVCIEGLGEDAIQELVNSLEVVITEEDRQKIVTSTGNIQVKLVFGSDGNFSGGFAKIGNKNVAIIPGALSQNMQIFKGSPSTNNPGPGWEPEVELTKTLLHQPDDQNAWTAFLASRTNVI